MRKNLFSLIILTLCIGFLFGGNYSSAKKTVGIFVKNKSVLLEKNATYKINYKLKTKKSKNKRVKFKSSNKKIIAVNKNGLCTAKKEGSAVVTVMLKANKKVKTKISFKVAQKKKNIALAFSQNLVNVGNTLSSLVKASNSMLLDNLLADGPTGGTNKDELFTNSLTYSDVPGYESYYELQTEKFGYLIPKEEKIEWSILSEKLNTKIGGINVYSDGSIYVTSDTPALLTATITAKLNSKKQTIKVVVVSNCSDKTKDHNYIEDTDKYVAPRCTLSGKKVFVCTICNKEKEEAVAPIGHDFSILDATRYNEPTCCSEGSAVYKCSHGGCTEEEKRIIEKSEIHKWGTGVLVSPATCTSSGKQEFTCTVDGCNAKKTETIPAKGHDYDDGETTLEPGCTTQGIIVETCKTCGNVHSVKIPAKNHTWTYGEIVKEPTCTFDGKRKIICEACGKEVLINVPCLGHDMVLDDSRSIDPTCTVSGKNYYVCSRDGCEYEEIKSVKAKGHEYAKDSDGNVKFVTDVSPTCSKKGEKHADCTQCSYVDKRSIPALGHQWDTDSDGQYIYTVDIAPTCITEGHKSIHCKRCSATKASKEIEPTGVHDFDLENWVIDRKATCKSDGEKSHHCKTKGCTKKTDITTIPRGHTWKTDEDGNYEYTIDVPPTCKVKGRKSVHCSRCGTINDTTVTDILPLGHDWDAGKTFLPTCVSDGKTIKTCNRCGEEDITKITKLGHNLVKNTEKSYKQTCNAAGLDCYYCDRSGCSYEKNEIIPADEHDFGAWTTKKAATATDAGYKTRECNVCHEIQHMGISPVNNPLSVTYENTVADDWMYSLDITTNSIVLNYYIGNKKYIKIPKTMDIKDKQGNLTTYNVTFKVCDGRVGTGFFSSSYKTCDIEGVEFADGINLTNMTYFFQSCMELKEVKNIPDTVTNMVGTFKNCKKLVSVQGSLPSMIKDLTMTFYGCESLQTTVEIPDFVTNLDQTFLNTNITEAPEIPSGVTNMQMTFANCKKLFMPPTLPSSLVDFTSTFDGCENLQECAVDNNGTIPENVSDMITTYNNCTSLKKAKTIPATVKTMRSTFANCKELVYSPIIPAKIDQKDVFLGCDKLKY